MTGGGPHSGKPVMEPSAAANRDRRPESRLWMAGAACAAFLCAGLLADELAWLSDLRTVVQRAPARFPSTLAVPAEERSRPGALLSVYTADRFLHDPAEGLLANPTAVGRDWERPATVSYFEDGALRFAANVGLRVHGGKSRTGSPVQSFRLYFRREYGSVQFRAGTLFGGRGDPLTRLVAHNDLRLDQRGRWWRMVNPLAFDIARRIGALAPETRPASFVLNGEPQGLYVLTEHVRRPFLLSRFGHDNFERASEPRRIRWTRDVVLPPPAFTLADTEGWIDVEGLTRWFVSVVFCGTSDPFQAVMFRDRTRPGAPWFWVNWDMDHSFMDYYRQALAPWRQDTFAATLRGSIFEGHVLRRLIADDPQYRRHLADTFLDALNYRLTRAFLDERFRHYRGIAARFGLENAPYLEGLAEFLALRPRFVREMLVRHLGIEPLQRVTVEAPPGTPLRIDGHPVSAGFAGFYERGREIRVEVADAAAGFTHWIAGGRHVAAPVIRQRVDSDLVLTAAFRPGR